MADSTHLTREKELEAQIALTKASLNQKVSALTMEVRDEVKDTLGKVKSEATRVADKVESSVHTITGRVDEGLKTVTEKVSGTVDTVKGTVHGVKSTLDVPARIQTDPLKMFALSVAGGFLGYNLVARKREERRLELRRPVIREVRRPVGLFEGARESQAAVQKQAGLMALVGLVGTVLRPLLVSAAKELIVRKISAGAQAQQGFEGDAQGEFAGRPLHH